MGLSEIISHTSCEGKIFNGTPGNARHLHNNVKEGITMIFTSISLIIAMISWGRAFWRFTSENSRLHVSASTLQNVFLAYSLGAFFAHMTLLSGFVRLETITWLLLVRQYMMELSEMAIHYPLPTPSYRRIIFWMFNGLIPSALVIASMVFDLTTTETLAFKVLVWLQYSLAIIIIIYLISIQTIRQVDPDSQTHMHWATGITTFLWVLSATFWYLDLETCIREFPYFHGFFHVFHAIVIYNINFMIEYLHLTLHTKEEIWIEFRFYLLVELIPKKPSAPVSLPSVVSNNNNNNNDSHFEKMSLLSSDETNSSNNTLNPSPPLGNGGDRIT